MKKNLVLLFATLAVLVPNLAFAADPAVASGMGWVAMAAGLAIGLAALGGAIGQGKAAAADRKSVG